MSKLSQLRTTGIATYSVEKPNIEPELRDDAGKTEKAGALRELPVLRKGAMIKSLRL